MCSFLFFFSFYIIFNFISITFLYTSIKLWKIVLLWSWSRLNSIIHVFFVGWIRREVDLYTENLTEIVQASFSMEIHEYGPYVLSNAENTYLLSSSAFGETCRIAFHYPPYPENIIFFGSNSALAMVIVAFENSGFLYIYC